MNILLAHPAAIHKYNINQEVYSRWISILSLLLAGFLIGFLSYNTFWTGDDIAFGFDWRNRKFIYKNIGEIFSGLGEFYVTANGRVVAHFFGMGFSSLWGHTAFAICNGLMYIAFFLCIARLCKVSIENYKGYLSIVLLGLITFQTKMMPIFQICFVWMFTLTMAVLIIFFDNKRTYRSWWWPVTGGLFAVVAGNGMEALNLGIAVAFFIYWITNFRKMTPMQYFLMFGFWIGVMTDIFSPGTLNRGSHSIGTSLNRYFFNFITFLFNIRALWFMLAVLIYRKLHDKITWMNIYKPNSFYFNAIVILFLFNILIRFESNRAAFGIELMALIIGLRLLKLHAMNYFWLTVFFVWLAVSFTFQGINIFKKKHFFAEVEKQYDNSKDGRVFIDWDFSTPIQEQRNFSGPFVPLGVNNFGDFSYYEYGMIAKYLKTKYPGKPSVRILPTFLKGRDNADLGNQLIYLGDNLWLAIQSKSKPARFEVNREVPFFPSLKSYEPEEVDMDDRQTIIGENQYWRSRYIAEIDYAIHGFNFSREIEMKNPIASK